MQTGLYIVGTPIGNLSDMSPRAIEVLRSADLIAAEDTRVFGKLASHFDIKTPRCAMHDHNERDVVPDLIEKMQHGMTVAAVSDAGMPGVSDPGFRLVRECRAAGVPVFVVPGPTAAVSALVLSGFPTDRFTFCGFFDEKKCVMTIKSGIQLFITKAQTALCQQLHCWHVSCQSGKSPSCARLQRFMKKR